MNVLHHDNRIVDDETHGNHDGHQRQVVQAESGQVHHRTGGDQGNTQHGGNDQSRRPLAQEHGHHPNDQHDGDDQGQHDLMQRGANGAGTVVENLDLHGRRQRLA